MIGQSTLRTRFYVGQLSATLALSSSLLIFAVFLGRKNLHYINGLSTVFK